MFEQIATSFGLRLLRRLPSLVLRRFFPPEAIASQLEIELRANCPGELSDAGALPELRLWFLIRNNSAFPVTIDRLLLEAWVGQPVAHLHALDRITIPPRETREAHARSVLSDSQREYITQKATRWQTIPLRINYTAWADSKLGSVRCSGAVDRDDFPCRLQFTPKASLTKSANLVR